MRGVHPVERPARADETPTARSAGGVSICTSRYAYMHEQICIYARADMHEQVRYPAYTANSNIDSECRQNGVAD